jgi:GTPase SAR1 family protein
MMMMAQAVRVDHAKLKEALETMCRAEVPLGLTDAAGRLAPYARRYTQGLMRVLLVGEIKKGKSSLANGLLGCPDLVPTAADVATSTVFKIMYGPRRRYRVFFERPDDGSPNEPRDIDPSEVADYGTEAGNPNNEKGVEFIGVEYPHPLLEAGMVLIDLPGLGGIYENHSRLTLQYLPKADAVLFVVDSTEQVLGQSEIDTLSRLSDARGRIAFVQTKIDLASETQWRGWRKRNIEIIGQKLGIDRSSICYFAVSSRLKEIADEDQSPEDARKSGFPDLAHFISAELLPAAHDALAGPLAAALMEEADAAAGPLRERLAIVSAEDAEALRLLDTTCRKAQDGYTAWKSEELPRVQKIFDDGFTAAHNMALDRIRRELASSSTGPIVGSKMREIEGLDLSTATLAEKAPEIVDKVILSCGQILAHIGDEFDEATSSAFYAAAEEIGRATTIPAVQMAPSVIAVDHGGTSIRLRGGIFETTRSGFVSGSFGGMFGGVLASIIFPPAGLGIIALSIAGAVYGMVRGVKDFRQQQRSTVLEQYRRILSDIVQRMQTEANVVFDRHQRERRADMHRSMRETVDGRDKELRAAIGEAEAQRHRTREQSSAAIRDLREKITTLESVSRSAKNAILANSSAA